MFSVTDYTFASSSTDFELDYDSLSTGSEQYTSSNFTLQSGPLSIETNSNSNDFQITTVNLISVCGNGIIETVIIQIMEA